MARTAAAARAKNLWFQVTRVHSLLSSRHARPELGTLLSTPPLCSALYRAICTRRFNTRHRRLFLPRESVYSIGTFAPSRRPRPLPNRLREIVAPALDLRFPG